MKHSVIMLAQAEADADVVFAWIAEQSRAGAEQWYEGLRAAMGRLESLPLLGPYAREGKLHGRELRQLRYGSYRIVFFVARSEVKVVTIRHSGRPPAPTQEL